MEFMKKIILCACFLSIVITIADSIQPGEKFSRQLEMIFSLVFVTGIVSVALSCDFDFEIPAFAEVEDYDSYNNLDDTADQAVKDETEKRINEYIENLLEENGIGFEKISSEININEDNSISINRIGYKGEEFEQARSIICENIDASEVNRIE
ncbi:hypothetical protein [Porcipelethomonas sp.]|uniref:hypothetical protein n=1 Tax=Porcipelethomonas sp. TaxID=2981675 RepID=UPI003EF6E4C2